MCRKNRNSLGRPRRAASLDDQSYPVTFFITASQRRALLAVLGRTHRDRARALLMRLSVDARVNVKSRPRRGG